MINFNDYQELAARTSGQSDTTMRLLNGALGLGGEAGEAQELVKKHCFHGHTLDKLRLKKELGDVLWYLAELASASGISLQDVAEHNIGKLMARYPDGFSSEASLNRKEGDT